MPAPNKFNISQDLQVFGNATITGNTDITGTLTLGGTIDVPAGAQMTSPITFIGVPSSSQTNYLVIDGSGNLSYNASGGGGGGTFTGGTVSGATRFTGGLTANTISATTYQNLPTTNQYLIVAGTGSPEVPSSGQLILNPSEGEVFEIYISKTTYDGINNSSVIEGIKNSILVFNNSLFYSIYTLSFVSDFATYVRFGATLTGGDDYFTTNGQIVGATFISFGSVNTLTTVGTSGAATLVGNTLNIPQYGGGGGTFSGGTVTGPTNFTNGLSANTFSASTYQGNVVTQITAGSGISVDQSTGNVTITSTGGGGGTSLGLVYTTGNNLNFI